MSQRFCITVALVVALASLQSVLAHYTVTYPSSRGFDETKEPTAPCGGFDTVGTRTPFPLEGGFVEINSGHTSYSYVVNLLVESAPTTADFSNSTANVQVATGSRSYPQAACLSLDDLSKNAAAKAGANATIQVVYNGGDGALYQCIDVTLADTVASWNNSKCVNFDGSSASSSGSAATASSTQSPSNANSLTYTAGLMFAIAACLALVIN